MIAMGGDMRRLWWLAVGALVLVVLALVLWVGRTERLKMLGRDRVASSESAYLPLENIQEAQANCALGTHDLPDPEDAWEAGWPIGPMGMRGGTVKECLRCGRSFRLAPGAWIDIQAEKDAWDREHRKKVKLEEAACKRVKAWEARQAQGGSSSVYLPTECTGYTNGTNLPWPEPEKKAKAAKPQRKALPEFAITWEPAECLSYYAVQFTKTDGVSDLPDLAADKGRYELVCQCGSKDVLAIPMVGDKPAMSAATNFMSPFGYARWRYWQNNGEWIPR